MKNCNLRVGLTSGTRKGTADFGQVCTGFMHLFVAALLRSLSFLSSTLP